MKSCGGGSGFQVCPKSEEPTQADVGITPDTTPVAYRSQLGKFYTQMIEGVVRPERFTTA